MNTILEVNALFFFGKHPNSLNKQDICVKK